MELTKQLKDWLIAQMGVAADASDEDFRKAAGEAFASGKLSAEKYTELTTTPEQEQAAGFEKKLDGLAAGLEKLAEIMAEKKAAPPEEKPAEQKAPEQPAEQKAPEQPAEQKAPEQPEWHKGLKRVMGSDVPHDEYGNVRVKGAWEAYDSTKSAAVYPQETKQGQKHPLAGQRVRDMGRDVDTLSDRDKAVAGAYAKYAVEVARKGSKNAALASLPQHDRELLYYSMDKMTWGGSIYDEDYAEINDRKLTPSEQKALIDDATSGGLEAAPIVFDDMVIETPLLYGELFPLVNTVNLERGRRVEGVSIGTVTGSWGGVDDSAISLFNTNSYVAAFDTTVYRWEGAIRIGLDFLSDTPINFAQIISRQYGERLLEDLDDVIAIGNGTTQPEGVMNASGTTSVAFGGSNSISNIESLRYGVAKAEHRSTVANSAVFCGNETTYQRWRALPVSSSDDRRLFGNDHLGPGAGGYMVSNAKYAVNESMANTQAFYCIMARYRMYRRRGLVMRSSTEGDTLIRANELLLAGTARYGGQLERGAVAAVSTTLPA